MKFKVEWAETRVLNGGKEKKSLSGNREDGSEFSADIWSDFPSYQDVGPGSVIEGDLSGKDYNGKTYYTIYPPRAPKAATGGQGGGMRGVAAAQQRKGDMIEKAQENKSHAIKVASAMRDATTLIGALGYKFETSEEMWEMHKSLRSRYIKEWDITEKAVDVPFTDAPRI